MTAAAWLAARADECIASNGSQEIHGSRETTLCEVLAHMGATRGAEIGVEQGCYAAALLAQVPGLHLVCVDAWQAYPGYREHVTQAKLEGFYAATCARLAGQSATIIRAWSEVAAAQVRDGSLDVVYIDANHTLPYVIADLACWAPKVRPGGIVAGHDYGRARVGQVREAVDAWTAAYQIAPWYVLTGDKSPTWLWVQP